MRTRVRFLVEKPVEIENGLILPVGRHPGFVEQRSYGTLQGPEASPPRYWIDVSAAEFKSMGGKITPNSAGAAIDLGRLIKQGLVKVEH